MCREHISIAKIKAPSKSTKLGGFAHSALNKMTEQAACSVNEPFIVHQYCCTFSQSLLKCLSTLWGFEFPRVCVNKKEMRQWRMPNYKLPLFYPFVPYCVCVTVFHLTVNTIVQPKITITHLLVIPYELLSSMKHKRRNFVILSELLFSIQLK